MIHLLCQCTLNNYHYERTATELNASDIDQSLIYIIKLYIKKNPNVESLALYFNNETDSNIGSQNGIGTYFTIGELYIGGVQNKVTTLSNIPFEYFCVGGKRVYIVSEVNILFSKEYIKHLYEKDSQYKSSNITKYEKWLIKYEEDWSRHPDIKRHYKIIRNTTSVHLKFLTFKNLTICNKRQENRSSTALFIRNNCSK